MALIRIHGKGFQSIPKDKAIAIWYVMTGEMQGTPKQKEFAKTVQKLYIGYKDAPASYLKANKAILEPMIKMNGPPMKPDMWYDER